MSCLGKILFVVFEILVSLMQVSVEFQHLHLLNDKQKAELVLLVFSFGILYISFWIFVQKFVYAQKAESEYAND